MEKGWSPEQITAVLGALTVLIGALATAAVKIIQTLRNIRDEITHQTAQMNSNADQITGTIRGTGDGGEA